jgi:hypothetical protein
MAQPLSMGNISESCYRWPTSWLAAEMQLAFAFAACISCTVSLFVLLCGLRNALSFQSAAATAADFPAETKSASRCQRDKVDAGV